MSHYNRIGAGNQAGKFNFVSGITKLGSVDVSKILALSLKMAAGNEQNAANSGPIGKFCEAACGHFEHTPKGRGYF